MSFEVLTALLIQSLLNSFLNVTWLQNYLYMYGGILYIDLDISMSRLIIYVFQPPRII